MDKGNMLSYTEWVVMETLWEADRPLTNPEIYELSGKEGWQGTRTVNAITKRLAKRGTIKEGNVVKKAKAFAQEYVPTITAEEYLERQITESKKFQNHPDEVILTLFPVMINKQKIDNETLLELENIIQEYKKRVQKR